MLELQKIEALPAEPEKTELLAAAIKEILTPILRPMAELMAHNTEALEQLAAQQKIQSDRMEALERQIRLNTLVTPTQVRYINARIKGRSRELLAPRSVEDNAKAVKRLGGSIRKAVLSRYGVAALHDIPQHEYTVVMQQIATWNDMLVIRDVVRASKEPL